ATVSVNKEKAKIGESITMTVNTTYLGQPDASAPIKVTPVSATNRQNQSETPTAKVNGSDTATVNTNAAGNATFTLTDPNGKGVKTTFEATIHSRVYGSEQATFTTLTSPDVSSANFWGHMPNSIMVGERQFYRPPLASESTGDAGLTNDYNGERWGRMRQDEARTYCNNNLPELSVMEDLYAAYPDGNLEGALGWPTNLHYGTNTGDSVIWMPNGNVFNHPRYNTLVSCSELLPIDSTGVTIDILKEDGTYTNDKFPPSSTAMTYGALMFPGAGIRINLPDAVIPSTITVSAPTGYVRNIVGKSVELTDMVRDDYRDQIITVTGGNASGDVLGLRLKVSSSKYQNANKADYIPQPDTTGVITMKRDVTFPSRDIAWYQHGLVTSQRSGLYREAVGATDRYAAFEDIVKKRFDVSEEIGSPDQAGTFTSVFLYFIPAEKNEQWLREALVERIPDPNRTNITIQALSDLALPLGRWTRRLPSGVAGQSTQPYRPYIVEGTTPYTTPTSRLDPVESQTLLVSRATLRVCPQATGTFLGPTQKITDYFHGTLPVNPIALRSNASILRNQYRSAINGLESSPSGGATENNDLISGFVNIMDGARTIHIPGNGGPSSEVLVGDPFQASWNPLGHTTPYEWAGNSKYWGIMSHYDLVTIDVIMDRVNAGLGHIPAYDEELHIYHQCTNKHTPPGTQSIKIYNACVEYISGRCGSIVESLSHDSAQTLPIRTDGNIRVGTAVPVTGTPEVIVRKFPIK
ncbi:hypothetical protein K6327_004521, partial [Vibrio vulnificus]|nr:hypothetical protein [Vibrio vulnificus]